MKSVRTEKLILLVFRIAYLEVYNDQMCDLLRTVNSQADYQQQQMSIGEDSGLVYVKGLSYRIANSEEDALNLLFEGETNRAIGQHVLNKQSSRSHCIFTILIECRSILSSEEKYTISKLNLVDLAGSERLAKTNVRTKGNYFHKSTLDWLRFDWQKLIFFSQYWNSIRTLRRVSAVEIGQWAELSVVLHRRVFSCK